MNPTLAVLVAVVVLAVLFRPARLPRQLTERWADFDEAGRPW